VTTDGFSFPLGVYPIEPLTPKAGYTMEFEPADGGEAGTEDAPPPPGADDGGTWEEWPDRYVFDIVISAERVEALVRSLLTLLPGRIYPILDYLGLDAYREVDPYISYDLMGTDRLTDALRRYRGFFFEDGLCGFGAMVDDPFIYLFVDEHKIVTVRVQPEMKERVEKLLHAFDLEAVEAPAGADAAAHEHRGVLSTADDRPDLLTADEIVEHLRDEWRLVLNIDRTTNLDEDGRELGLTPWLVLIRCIPEGQDKARYLECALLAENLGEAEEWSMRAADDAMPDDITDWAEVDVVSSDRLTDHDFIDGLKSRSVAPPSEPREPGVIWHGWLEDPPAPKEK
jgi:hypothetical protein